jgi:hypothetical protein
MDVGALAAMITRAFAAAALALRLGAPTPSVHPIPTTLTVVTVDAAHRTLTLSIRAFADDFSAAVARAPGHAAPADTSAPVDDVTRYVRAHFTNVWTTLEPCGIRRVDEAYLLCFRAALPAHPASSAAQNSILTELHPDHVNIVQVQDGHDHRTHIFTKGGGAKELFGAAP